MAVRTFWSAFWTTFVSCFELELQKHLFIDRLSLGIIFVRAQFNVLTKIVIHTVCVSSGNFFVVEADLCEFRELRMDKYF